MAARNIEQFEGLFREYFTPLTGFAMKYVPSQEEAKNIVHEIYISVWEKFDDLPPDTHFRSYLYSSVRNRCLNFIRDQKKVISMDHSLQEVATSDSHEMERKELEREIEMAINALPDKCKVVFEMSRFEELKYAEIAEKLDISVKTVEGRMTQALAMLRDSLSQFITISFLCMEFQGYLNVFVF